MRGRCLSWVASFPRCRLLVRFAPKNRHRQLDRPRRSAKNRSAVTQDQSRWAARAVHHATTNIGRARTRPKSLGRRFDIPVHFQARQQLDIARATVNVSFLDARGLIRRAGLIPDWLELIARCRLILSASFLLDLRSSVELALPRYVEFRQTICDGDDGERSK